MYMYVHTSEIKFNVTSKKIEDMTSFQTNIHDLFNVSGK